MSETIRLFLISDGALNVDDYVRNLTTTVCVCVCTRTHTHTHTHTEGLQIRSFHIDRKLQISKMEFSLK